MNTEIIKKPQKWLVAFIVFGLILAGGIFIFFFRLYNHDVKSLTDFMAAYGKYDQAISDFSIPVLTSNPENTPATNDLERQADEALVVLNSKASVRLSSLIINDADLMSTTHEIAVLSSKELAALNAYKSAVSNKNADLGKLAKEFGNLTSQRKIAYARFRGLGGLNN